MKDGYLDVLDVQSWEEDGIPVTQARFLAPPGSYTLRLCLEVPQSPVLRETLLAQWPKGTWPTYGAKASIDGKKQVFIHLSHSSGALPLLINTPAGSTPCSSTPKLSLLRSTIRSSGSNHPGVPVCLLVVTTSPGKRQPRFVYLV
jgi:hypothetical protein